MINPMLLFDLSFPLTFLLLRAALFELMFFTLFLQCFSSLLLRLPFRVSDCQFLRQLFFPFICEFFFLASFILVLIWNLLDLNFIILCESDKLLAQDLLDSWNFEEAEAVGYCSDVKEVETENECQLMLLVVSNKTNESILRFIDQVFVFFHRLLKCSLNI